MQPGPKTDTNSNTNHELASDLNADQQVDEEASEGSHYGDFSSKSAKKREAERLTKMGKELTTLSAEQLRKLELHDKLLDALLDYQRFKSHGAKKRQLLAIGGVLRKIDVAEVEAKLAVLNGEAASARYELHQLELWRDRLLADSQALTQYLDEHKATDRQQLRQIVQKAQRATQRGKSMDTPQAKAAARVLFRFLRDSNPNNPEDNEITD